MKLYIYWALVCFIIAKSNCQKFDSDVERGEVSYDEEPTNSAADGSKGNSVVVLGVTLSLSVIFAIAGIFIGLYFHVERLLCCCKKGNKADEISKLETGDTAWYGNNKSTNMFMTSVTNQAYLANENQPHASDEADENGDKDEKKGTYSKQKLAPKRKPILPQRGGNKQKNRPSMTAKEEPVGFGTTHSQVTGNGTIIRSPETIGIEIENRENFKKVRQNTDTETSYKPFSTQQDDILF